MAVVRSSMNDLNQLVLEALERRREEHQGCFVHNAAAAELLGYGGDAVDAIESGVLASLPDESGSGSFPCDLDSVMVMYTRLVRQLQLEHRCAAFLRGLPPRFRTSGLRAGTYRLEQQSPKAGSFAGAASPLRPGIVREWHGARAEGSPHGTEGL